MPLVFWPLIFGPSIGHAAGAWFGNAHRHSLSGTTQFTVAEIGQGSISTKEHGFELGEYVAGELSAISGEKPHQSCRGTEKGFGRLLQK